MQPSPFVPQRASRVTLGFTLMEILVVVSIIIVLAAIAVPAYTMAQKRAQQTAALNTMKQITAALHTYVAQNDGVFPAEDCKGTDTWKTASDPANNNVWYNCLPRQMGTKGVGDFGNDPRAFYSKANPLYLQGAGYPPAEESLQRPLFAIAINTKLQRKGESGVKMPARLASMPDAGRTVIFLEQGLPKEKKAMAQQPKYDGSCKGSAKSFVARHGESGVLSFLDGHAELVRGDAILQPDGSFPFPQTGIVWTRSAEENPNK
jgi:prepilin-type processing-associated H-X9-DG protein